MRLHYPAESDYAATLRVTRKGCPNVETLRLHGAFKAEYEKLSDDAKAQNFRETIASLRDIVRWYRGTSATDKATYFQEARFGYFLKRREFPNERLSPLVDLPV